MNNRSTGPAEGEALRRQDYTLIAEAVAEFLGFDITTREQQDRITRWATAQPPAQDEAIDGWWQTLSDDRRYEEYVLAVRENRRLRALAPLSGPVDASGEPLATLKAIAARLHKQWDDAPSADDMIRLEVLDDIADELDLIAAAAVPSSPAQEPLVRGVEAIIRLIDDGVTDDAAHIGQMLKAVVQQSAAMQNVGPT